MDTSRTIVSGIGQFMMKPLGLGFAVSQLSSSGSRNSLFTGCSTHNLSLVGTLNPMLLQGLNSLVRAFDDVEFLSENLNRGYAPTRTMRGEYTAC